nr:nucleotidyl transferase AbiEii/AbiGii toxin family protein [Phytoactinopolyspora mesophila]
MEFKVSTKIGTYPKVLWRADAIDGSPVRIKIEVNTREREPQLAPLRVRHEVESGWWAGGADVLTCDPTELMATKIRALYQRSKGRDLFDLWLALTELELSPAEIVRVFAVYRPPGLSSAVAERNLQAKLDDAEFRHDLHPLLVAVPDGYDIDVAGQLVTEELLRRL